jgi:hypothetical protein
MAAAVYEGLLGWKLSAQSKSLGELISLAHSGGFIENQEAHILNKAREHRNLVHASKFDIPWVQRADAMDIRTTIDGLIRKLAHS